MSNVKYNLIVGLLIVIVCIVAGSLGIYFGGGFKPKVIANGIVMAKDKDALYKNQLLTNYTEYNNLLNEYKLRDIVLYTNNDFNERDYIVDYIDYDDSMEIKDIELEVLDDGMNITYYVSKKIKNGKYKLMYFIPIDKGIFNTVDVKNRKFIEK